MKKSVSQYFKLNIAFETIHNRQFANDSRNLLDSSKNQTIQNIANDSGPFDVRVTITTVEFEAKD